MVSVKFPATELQKISCKAFGKVVLLPVFADSLLSL